MYVAAPDGTVEAALGKKLAALEGTISALAADRRERAGSQDMSEGQLGMPV